MSIREWPKQEKPTEKVFAKGAEFLSNAELLALFLRSGTKERNAIELSQDIIKKFGSLRKLLSASPRQLLSLKGIGRHKAAMLNAVLELGKRSLEEYLYYYSALNSSEKTKRYLIMQLSHRKSEIFGCLFLNTRNQLIRYEELFQGTLDSTSIYPRIVLQKALEYNAASVIFAHNHPSGNASPSEFDRMTTQQLVKVLAQVAIRVNDHIIVGENDVFSFAEAGLLD